MSLCRYIPVVIVATAFVVPATVCTGQQAPAPDQDQEKTNKGRVFWIIPNNRTSPSLDHYKPFTAREKFRLGISDSLDPGTAILAAITAGEGQLGNSTPEFGQGISGYSHYLGASYGDFLIGDFMSEAVYPSLLHQDPRYFRRGTGSMWSRVGYAMGQILWTHDDSGHRQFNFSELAGNSTAVAISNAYYPDNRTAGGAASKLGFQFGFDAAGNILTEFWPDIERKFFQKH